MIIQLSYQGKTIIMASHILDEVEKVCSHVAIIQKGVLKTVGTVHEILSTNSTANVQVVEIASDDIKLLESVVKDMPGVSAIELKNGTLHIITDDSVQASTINRYCFEKGIVLNTLLLKRKSLESTFLEITGNQSDR